MITGMPRIAIAVRNMDEAIGVFRGRFGMPVSEVPRSVQSLGVRIAVCTPPGGSTIELMSPAAPGEPLNESDGLFGRLRDPQQREAVLLRLQAADRIEAGALLAERDIVLG